MACAYEGMDTGTAGPRLRFQVTRRKHASIESIQREKKRARQQVEVAGSAYVAQVLTASAHHSHAQADLQAAGCLVGSTAASAAPLVSFLHTAIALSVTVGGLCAHVCWILQVAPAAAAASSSNVSARRSYQLSLS